MRRRAVKKMLEWAGMAGLQEPKIKDAFRSILAHRAIHLAKVRVSDCRALFALPGACAISQRWARPHFVYRVLDWRRVVTDGRDISEWQVQLHRSNHQRFISRCQSSQRLCITRQHLDNESAFLPDGEIRGVEICLRTTCRWPISTHNLRPLEPNNHEACFGYPADFLAGIACDFGANHAACADQSAFLSLGAVNVP